MAKKKNIFWIYLVLITSSLGIWSYVFLKSRKANTGNAINTEAMIENKIINMGIRPLKKSVDTFFVVENTGNSPLIIQNVKTDCHCTAPTWEDKPILPHKKTLIKVSYDGRNLGYFQKRIMVECNVLHSPLLLVLRGEMQ